MLFFKGVFADAIRSGRKTTTLRRWERARCSAGQTVFAPGVGYLRVTAVDTVALDALTEPDAHADGFATLAELRATLCEIYPELAGADPRALLYRVSFVFDRAPESAGYRPPEPAG